MAAAISASTPISPADSMRNPSRSQSDAQSAPDNDMNCASAVRRSGAGAAGAGSRGGTCAAGGGGAAVAGRAGVQAAAAGGASAPPRPGAPSTAATAWLGGAARMRGARRGRGGHRGPQRSAARRGRGAARQQLRHLAHQLRRLEGLAQHVVGLGLRRLLEDAVVDDPGDQEHGHASQPRVTLHEAADLVAVTVGHDDVAHHEVGLLALDLGDGLVARGGGHHVQLLGDQRPLHHLSHAQCIVDDEHLCHDLGPPFRGALGRGRFGGLEGRAALVDPCGDAEE